MPYVAASSGIAEGDFERLGDICENVPDVRLICLDVANGYSQFFVEYVRTQDMISQILNILPCEPAMLSRRKSSGDPLETLRRGSPDFLD